jgi:hypothetical protein
MKTKEDITKEVDSLVDTSRSILLREYRHKKPEEFKKAKLASVPDNGPIHQEYQNWYTRSFGIVRSLMPERLNEFSSCYQPDPKRKETDWLSYTISDYLLGMVVTRGGEELFEPFGSFAAKMQRQITILTALRDTLDTRIADVESVLQAKLFDTELDTAQELAKRGHLRAAGAVAGVVLESHLGNLAKSKSVACTKRSPSISDFNEALKIAGVLDTPTWRHIQRLGDIRNLSVHSKDRAPSKDEIDDLIRGVRKFLGELN